ncbi:MAG: hypothetical protein LBI69_01720 [Puniceicoccales bacterium]|nr:hypothetical protein [Puniceicoccales bacterium]
MRFIADSGHFLASQEILDTIYNIAKFINSSKLKFSHVEWYDSRLKTFVIAEVNSIIKSGNHNSSIKIHDHAASQQQGNTSRIFTFLDAQYYAKLNLNVRG